MGKSIYKMEHEIADNEEEIFYDLAEPEAKATKQHQANPKPKAITKINKLKSSITKARNRKAESQPEIIAEPLKPVLLTSRTDVFQKYKNHILDPESRVDADSVCESFKLTSIMKIKTFVKHIKCYALNSPLDEEHYKYFSKTILKQKGMYFLDRISLAQYNEYQTTEASNLIEIINGHHRIEGLKRFFDRTPEAELEDYKICLRIDVYMLDKPDSENTLTLFRNFNRVRPQKTNWEAKELTQIIINKLNGIFYYNTFILVKDSAVRVNKPSILKKEFSEKLEKHLEQQRKTIPSLDDYDNIVEIANKITTKFQNYNDSLKMETLEWFKAHKETSDITDKMFDKACKCGCFLGFMKLEHLISHCVSL